MTVGLCLCSLRKTVNEKCTNIAVKSEQKHKVIHKEGGTANQETFIQVKTVTTGSEGNVPERV